MHPSLEGFLLMVVILRSLYSYNSLPKTNRTKGTASINWWKNRGRGL